MTFTPAAFAVWFEIPVSDLDASVAFYNEVAQTKLEIDNTGPNPMAIFPTKAPGSGPSGHLYPGKPITDGSGPTIHLAIPGKLEDAMARTTAAGGTVISPIVTIPPGRFVYAQDLDGNSIGLFETA